MKGFVGIVIASSLALLASAAQASDPASLKALWHMDDAFCVSTTCTTPDESGFDNNATIKNGAAIVDDGMFDRALSFDGRDGYATVGHSRALDVTLAYTIEAWLIIDDADTHRPIVVRGAPDVDDIEIYVQAGSHHLIVAHNRGNGGTFDFVGFVDPPLGVFFHLVVTFDGTTVRAYYNGAPVATAQQTPLMSAPLATNKGWFLGKVDHMSFAGFGCPSTAPVICVFKGLIDEVRIWSRVLSPSEVKVGFDMGDQRLTAGGQRPTPGFVPKEIHQLAAESSAVDGSEIDGNVDTRRWDLRTSSIGSVKVYLGAVTAYDAVTIASVDVTRHDNATVTAILNLDGGLKGKQLQFVRAPNADSWLEFDLTFSDGSVGHGEVRIRPVDNRQDGR